MKRKKVTCLPPTYTHCWGHFKTFSEAEKERISLAKHGNKSVIVDLINHDTSLNIYRWGVAYKREKVPC